MRETLAAEREASASGMLSPRETTILVLIGDGLSNKEIARELGNTPETVKTHVSSIFLKLGVSRRAQAVHDYLVAKGISGSRMRTISYGKERPVAVCDDISCWSQNRRAVTVLNGAAGS